MRKLKKGDKVLSLTNVFYGLSVLTVLKDEEKGDKHIAVQCAGNSGGFQIDDLILVESKKGQERLQLIDDILTCENELREMKTKLFKRKK
jgi:hypothetical protein